MTIEEVRIWRKVGVAPNLSGQTAKSQAKLESVRPDSRDLNQEHPQYECTVFSLANLISSKFIRGSFRPH